MMELETIDALSFDKENTFDRVVGCSIICDNGDICDIYDINHMLFRAPVILDGCSMSIRMELKKGYNKLLERCHSILNKEAFEFEVAMSNDQMSLLIMKCKNVTKVGFKIIDGIGEFTFTGTNTSTWIESNYPETEYIMKRKA